MEEDEPFEPGDEITFWVVVAKDVGAPEGWEAIVTLPLSDGSKATAVFLSAGTADPVLRRIEEENPDRDVGATPHGKHLAYRSAGAQDRHRQRAGQRRVCGEDGGCPRSNESGGLHQTAQNGRVQRLFAEELGRAGGL